MEEECLEVMIISRPLFVFCKGDAMAGESRFQRKLITSIRDLIPGCIVLKNDPNYLQGFPDWLILYKSHWAAIEAKRSTDADIQQNQDYYIDLLNRWSYASFAYPENMEKVLYELQQSFRLRR